MKNSLDMTMINIIQRNESAFSDVRTEPEYARPIASHEILISASRRLPAMIGQTHGKIAGLSLVAEARAIGEH